MTPKHSNDINYTYSVHVQQTHNHTLKGHQAWSSLATYIQATHNHVAGTLLYIHLTISYPVLANNDKHGTCVMMHQLGNGSDKAILLFLEVQICSNHTQHSIAQPVYIVGRWHRRCDQALHVFERLNPQYDQTSAATLYIHVHVAACIWHKCDSCTIFFFFLVCRILFIYGPE